ncbi:hypothetical protein Tco_0645233 [Tanacetum coccineum]
MYIWMDEALLDYEHEKLNNLMNLESNGQLMSRREYALLLRESTNDVLIAAAEDAAKAAIEAEYAKSKAAVEAAEGYK